MPGRPAGNVKLLLKDLQEKELSVDSSKASGFRSMKPRPNLALLLAVDSGAADTVRLLLEGNMSPNAPCAGKRPPLLSAIRDGHLDIVQVLCESSEVDVDAQDARGRSALHECVWRGDMSMLNILLGSVQILWWQMREVGLLHTWPHIWATWRCSVSFCLQTLPLMEKPHLKLLMGATALHLEGPVKVARKLSRHCSQGQCIPMPATQRQELEANSHGH